MPVDTEAIRPEDVELARRWAGEQRFDCIVSADGDGDRPLVSDEHGVWLRGDVVGILCARYLGAETVVTPVSCNSAVELGGEFRQVIRTRIGSPFVIEGMMEAAGDGGGVVGYEANGGFLTGGPIRCHGELAALPTRDSLIVPLAILALAGERGVPVSGLLDTLPRRYTASDRIKAFPTERSRALLADLDSGDPRKDRSRIEAHFGELAGEVASVDRTDGLRITFRNGEVIHLRPSGNAPELRCYNEADDMERVGALNAACMEVLAKLGAVSA